MRGSGWIDNYGTSTQIDDIADVIRGVELYRNLPEVFNQNRDMAQVMFSKEL